MRYARAYIDAIGYELPAEAVTTASIEARLAPLYERLKLAPGQIEALTGVRERRFWPPGARLAQGATAAARRALHAADVPASALGAARVTRLRPRARLRRLRPCPTSALRPAGGVFDKEDPKGKKP